ncbi:GbsR/MarR family transcriptional regulator [Hyalangium versicolor]|uniref:GbsR/MarR family transcriptional regulator n=1 Tax=Hyalangium versicolor TaxID=2861190 RepID=UPI001CCB21E7|nr:MarR family transcriptional regulator [Hyalangium versicolor]
MEVGDKDGLFLTPEDHRFIEALGLHFENRGGFPRIGGRMLGLLMLAPKPLALGSIAELLKVSPASVSTNIRHFHEKGLVQEIGLPGDRRHYYVFSDGAWDHHFEEAIKGVTECVQIMRTRLASLGLENVCQQRFSSTIEFFEFFLGMVMTARDRWRDRCSPPQATTTPEPSRSIS